MYLVYGLILLVIVVPVGLVASPFAGLGVLILGALVIGGLVTLAASRAEGETDTPAGSGDDRPDHGMWGERKDLD